MNPKPKEVDALVEGVVPTQVFIAEDISRVAFVVLALQERGIDHVYAPRGDEVPTYRIKWHGTKHAKYIPLLYQTEPLSNHVLQI